MKLPSRKYRAPLLMTTILLVLPLLVFGFFLTTAPGTGREPQLFDFSRGQTLKKIAAELEERRVIRSARLFVLTARLHGDDGRVKAGYYMLNDGLTPAEILRRMVAGEVYEQRFAVPEGYSLYQIADLLAGRRLCDKTEFLRECFNRPLLQELGIDGKSVEGFLFPSTYDIVPNMTAADIIRLMVRQFEKVYARDFAERVRAGRMSRQEVVTLASLIEKEAVRPEEKPLIASVFYNRLRRHMPLQSDPTSVYGVRAFAGNVSKEDIARATPYNTYLIGGLPPGPIGNPGRGAIEAVLAPAATRYLYFVAKKDGTHYFSTTLDEHNQAVRRYLRSSVRQVARPVAEQRTNRSRLADGT